MFFLSFRLISSLFRLAEEAQREQIEYERARGARLPGWRPRTEEEADEADEDDEWLEKAEAYEKSRQWTKALKVYRELAKCSPVPDIVVKAKMGIKRVKRAQGF
jgi:hypothetical protein